MTEAPADIVLVEVAAGVATVTLNRPEARNALDKALRRALHRTLRDLDGRPDVRAIVLSGADPAFCAGLDLKELAAGGEALAGTGATGERADDRSITRGPFPDMATPVIGAVNGVAITGGFELALACDYLVASERARFADTHARVGIMPAWGLTVMLPRAIGIRRAKEMSTTGNFLDAQTALQWGLVNHVVPHEELLPFAQQLARDTTTIDPAAVQRMLQTYDEGALLDGPGAWRLEGEVAAAWQGVGLDPAAIEAARQQVVARGRTQL